MDKNSQNALVSVVIPTYNRSLFISDAIESVLNQTYEQIEIIVVDDGSTDKTREIVERYGSSVKYIFQKNSGPGSARNKGIRMSSGEYIAFLDSDDLWERGKVEEQVEFFKRNKAYALCCTDAVEVEMHSGKILNNSIADNMVIKNGLVFDHLLKYQFINSSTVMIKKQVLSKTGMFSETLRAFEDRYLYFNLARKHKIYFLNKKLVKTRIHNHNITGDQMIMYENFLKLYSELLSDESLTLYQKLQIRKSMAERHFSLAYNARLMNQWDRSINLYRKSFATYPRLRTVIACLKIYFLRFFTDNNIFLISKRFFKKK